VGMARFPQGPGYWLVASDGGVFGFGAASYFGGLGGSRLHGSIVGISAGSGLLVRSTPTAPTSSWGFDISWPQCSMNRPAPPYGFGIVGVTGGQLYTTNACVAQQWDWARANGSFAGVYVNSGAPTAVQYLALALGNALRCGINAGCLLDLWGRRGVDQALGAAGPVNAPMWWIDVETANQWTPDPAANGVILRAMIDELQRSGHRVGIYSTAYQWAKIAGTLATGLPTWIPGAPTAGPGAYCDAHTFGGGTAWIVQSQDPNFDTDVLCAAGLASYQVAFVPPSPVPVPHYPSPAPPPPAPRPVTTRPSEPSPDPPRDVLSPAHVASTPRRSRHSFGGWLAIAGMVTIGLMSGGYRLRDTFRERQAD
jgi:hypothetical protein